MEFPIYVLAVAIAISFVIGIFAGSWLEGRVTLRSARDLITQTAGRRKNMGSGEEAIARELDLVIVSTARKFLPKDEQAGWLAVAGETDPR